MPIRVALQHRTAYRFDRPVRLSPHEIRLRPAVHCRTPITAYSLRVTPEKHYLNWQQDVFGNWIARLVFPEPTTALDVHVDLVAEMTVVNPFDFFVEEEAITYPFSYAESMAQELAPFLATETMGDRFEAWLQQAKKTLVTPDIKTVDLLVALNGQVNRDISYLIRMEPGVQTPEETLTLRSGSCRDSAWLLVHVLRRMGLAARFTSGYSIQLKRDQPPLDGPPGADQDFTDLHAWAEVYIPGAGWIGLDPTSGLLASEGHLPLACTAAPMTAAPVTGGMEACESTLDFSMHIQRLVEDTRVTAPYTEAQWDAILALGDVVENVLVENDVRLTMGGEPTFVSVDDMEGPEWNIAALSPKKLALAEDLLQRLRKVFSQGALIHHGQGKWYPGEPLPRWALSCLWRTDGYPLWHDAGLLDHAGNSYRTVNDARRFADALAAQLGLAPQCVHTAYEDAAYAVLAEGNWPVNFDPLAADLKEFDERRRIAQLIANDLGTPAGYVLPLKPQPRYLTATGAIGASAGWQSCQWPLRRKHLFLIPGDSPLGLRLPINALPWVSPAERTVDFPRDPFQKRADLPVYGHAQTPPVTPQDCGDNTEVIHTALAVEVRNGVLHIFFPPLVQLEDWVDLVHTVEMTAAALQMPLRLEGYLPPEDHRLRTFKITPDPGVIEVNIHPATSWRECVDRMETLYKEARFARLGAEKFMLDGRHTGTGGGNHVTLGGATPDDSPLLRRPDVLVSLITFWQHHPALSYLFSGVFIGPTSQAPRIDEARHEGLYELEIAFAQLRDRLAIGQESVQPWLIDRALRHLLVDVTGNTHRAEFCIDKLYSPDGPTGRLGLVEFRGFEMPPHAQMSALQLLLLRTLVAHFWQKPYHHDLVRWGTALHDKFLLPYYITSDLEDVVRTLREAGYPFDMAWFAPFVEFRFPCYGTAVYDGITLELRQAIEPWHVLGEEVRQSGTARYVDSSVERLQVTVRDWVGKRYAMLCNGRPMPLSPTRVQGEYVAGIRYKAWNPYSSLHPTIGVQSPLVFDVVDKWNQRSIGGCTYHVVHPGGRGYDRFPVNAEEAEARRFSRFEACGHTPGIISVPQEAVNKDYPHTLDLRKPPTV